MGITTTVDKDVGILDDTLRVPMEEIADTVITGADETTKSVMSASLVV